MYTIKCNPPGHLILAFDTYPEAYKEAQDLANTFHCSVGIYPVGSDLHCFLARPQYLDLEVSERANNPAPKW